MTICHNSLGAHEMNVPSGLVRITAVVYVLMIAATCLVLFGYYMSDTLVFKGWVGVSLLSVFGPVALIVFKYDDELLIKHPVLVCSATIWTALLSCGFAVWFPISGITSVGDFKIAGLITTAIWLAPLALLVLFSWIHDGFASKE